MHRKRNYRGFVPPVGKVTHKEDFIPTVYKCFHCGNSANLNSGIIVDHSGDKGKCWASGRPNPPGSINSSPRPPTGLRKRNA